MITRDQFIEHLTVASDDLQQLYDDHIADHHELLLHVFMEDVLQYILHRLRQYGNNDGIVLRVLEHIDTAFTQGEDYVIEAIAVSFLEGLPHVEPTGRQLSEILPPALRSTLERHENQR